MEAFFFNSFINLFMAMMGLHCCAGFSLVAMSGFLLQWLLLLQSMGSKACRLQ